MYSKDIETLVEQVRLYGRRLFEVYPRWCHQENNDAFLLPYNREMLQMLYELSNIFSRCRVKALLLPAMQSRSDNQYGEANRDNLSETMTSDRALVRLLEHGLEGDTCLILQPQERPYSLTVFDSFPNFDVALRQADSWPAVIFWDSDDFAFIPIENKRELYSLFEIVRYERYPLRELKRLANNKRTPSHYIFQLSDLHFGAKNVNVAERRLRRLIRTQLDSMEIEDTVEFVITGDAVDSPKPAAECSYRDFSEFLSDQSGQNPVRVLGNHDVNNHGLAFLPNNQQLANIIADYPKIEVLEEFRTILLLFNSNTNGQLAAGEIGIHQMAEMGNKLDAIENREEYLLIAVLHHHVLPIPTPDYYDRRWFEKFVPDEMMSNALKLIDADLFMEWLVQRGVKLVLHGHKHAPYLTEHAGVSIVACGSSTGQIVHKEKGKTCMSYNLIKISRDTIVITQFAEEIMGAGVKDIRPETVLLRHEA